MRVTCPGARGKVIVNVLWLRLAGGFPKGDDMKHVRPLVTTAKNSILPANLALQIEPQHGEYDEPRLNVQRGGLLLVSLHYRLL